MDFIISFPLSLAPILCEDNYVLLEIISMSQYSKSAQANLLDKGMN